MLLQNKVAVIYGAGGGIGGGVARTFAAEGATVHLVGRTHTTLDAVAADIRAAGGTAEVAVLDVLDAAAVNDHVLAVVEKSGSLDVSMNLVNRGDSQGTPLIDMTDEQFGEGVTTGLMANFHTARAAARHMTNQGSGVILTVTSGSAGGARPLMGNTGVIDAAVETFLRYLAAEIGPAGVRVVGIHTAGVAETLTREKIGAVDGVGMDPQVIIDAIGAAAILRRAPRLAQVADTAAFLASDRAAGITASFTNVTCGLITG
ncbi:SDR family NAD(P)-dependent oxidoreductase [Actinokineospora sp.]|uniref:SDR family NAD(P)-dependent oxidoreductase n=1 Tax=Actinokineospora sp. TaxID=1872133 RepID=UPI004038224C